MGRVSTVSYVMRWEGGYGGILCELLRALGIIVRRRRVGFDMHMKANKGERGKGSGENPQL